MSETPAKQPGMSPDEARRIRHEAAAKLESMHGGDNTGGSTRVLPPRQWLALLATIALLAVGWGITFREMWYRWFEAWEYTELGLWQRFTEGQSYYTHGPLVAVASLIICWMIYRRVGLPVGRDRRSATVVGGILVAVFVVFHVLSSAAQVMFVSGFSLIGVIAGLVLLWGGWPLLRAYWLPIVLLFFMVPLPELAIADISFKLKNVAADGSTWIATKVFGIPAVRDGSYLYLPDDPITGEKKQMVVENVCSGLRSLISLTFFASMFALVCRVKGFWRLFMLIMAVPVAIACNVIRITGLTLMAHYYGMEHTKEGAAFHDWSGIAVFIVALAILFGLEYAIIGLSKWLKRDWVDVRLMGFLNDIRTDGRVQLRALRPVLLVLLASTMVWSFTLASRDNNRNKSDVASKALPSNEQQLIAVNGRQFHYRDSRPDRKTMAILQTEDILFRQYVSAEPGSWETLDLLIVYTPNNRKGTHPPEVCLEGGGNTVVKRSHHDVEVEGIGPITMRELITQNGRLQQIHLYVYKRGGGYTPSFFWQQFWVFVNGLVARDSSGALIRFSVPAPDGDIDKARQLATEMAAYLMPYIDRGLQLVDEEPAAKTETKQAAHATGSNAS